MPVIHEYVDGRGYYIKSSFEGTIVTHQVTPKGAQYLRKKRKGEGSRISTDELMRMQRRGYIYTGGSGPGDIDGIFDGWFSAPAKPRQRKKPRKKRSRKSQNPDCCCCAVVMMMLVMTTLPAAFLLGSFIRRRRPWFSFGEAKHFRSAWLRTEDSHGNQHDS